MGTSPANEDRFDLFLGEGAELELPYGFTHQSMNAVENLLNKSTHAAQYDEVTLLDGHHNADDHLDQGEDGMYGVYGHFEDNHFVREFGFLLT